jgi:hypothetical protein
VVGEQFKDCIVGLEQGKVMIDLSAFDSTVPVSAGTTSRMLKIG